MTENDIKRLVCKEGLLDFTNIMFREKTGHNFIIGKHQRLICNALDKVVAGQTKRLIINIAPRYGKTELVSKMFIAQGLALNPESKFIHLSYSDDLVRDNSRDINEMVRSPYFTNLFPEVQVTDTGAKLWRTSAGGGVYAVAAGGQVTGFGAGKTDEESVLDEMTASGTRFAGAIVIDDPLKPDDALSDVAREKVNARFDSTIRSRVNSRNTPIIIIMQRLHEKDLCGYLLANEPNEWEVLSLPCLTYDEQGEPHALWELKHNVADLLHLQEVNSYVFETQYQQNPKPREGLMYGSFKEYETLPVGNYVIKNYTDTADKGDDYLCSICYAEFPDNSCYVLDLLYTKKAMEYTEPETARMITRNKVAVAVVEANNGGRGFRRNVERNCREMLNLQTRFEDLTQTQNKDVRIFSHSNEVMNLVYFPVGWQYKWREYYLAMTSFRKEGRNAHDDAPDATTGIVEQLNAKQTTRFSRT